GLDSVGGVAGLNGSNAGGAVGVLGKTTAVPAAVSISTLNGPNGFIIPGGTPNDGLSYAPRAGAVHGDGSDAIPVSSVAADPNGITDAGQNYIAYGRPNFGANVALSSLLASNGGDGSAGYAINGFIPSGGSYIAPLGDVNNDCFADIRIAALFADV